MKKEIQFWDFITPFDQVVFCAVLLATVGAIVYGHRLRDREEKLNIVDYILMGRRMTLPLFTATLVATWYGGIFGVTELSFKYGIYNFVTQGVFWYASYLIFAFFVVKKARALKATTLPELVGMQFGSKASYLAGVFNLFNIVPIAYTISLGILLQTVFGMSLSMGCILGTAFVCLYSIFGGFRSVVFSDLIQFFVMCFSVLMVMGYSLMEFGGWGFLRSSLPETHFSITGGQPVSTLFVWGFIALSTLVDPNFYQRCFAAESDRTAKKGILIATGIWVVFDLCTTFGGMYARAVLPEAESSQAYLIYAMQLLPSGLRGFFLAGILATILSTIDSYLFVGSNTISYDLVPKKWRGIWLNRVGLVLVGIMSVVMASMFEGSIKDVWKTLGSYSAGCLLFPVMAAYIKPGFFTERSFIAGSILGAVGITYWRLGYVPQSLQVIDDLYIGILGTSVGMVLGKVGIETPSNNLKV